MSMVKPAQCVWACLRMCPLCAHLPRCGTGVQVCRRVWGTQLKPRHRLSSAVCPSASLSHHPHARRPAGVTLSCYISTKLALAPVQGLGETPTSWHSPGILRRPTWLQARLALSSGFRRMLHLPCHTSPCTSRPFCRRHTHRASGTCRVGGFLPASVTDSDITPLKQGNAGPGCAAADSASGSRAGQRSSLSPVQTSPRLLPSEWPMGGFPKQRQPLPLPQPFIPPMPRPHPTWKLLGLDCAPSQVSVPFPRPALGTLPALLKEVPPLVFLETAWRDLLICAPSLSFGGENPGMRVLDHLLRNPSPSEGTLRPEDESACLSHTMSEWSQGTGSPG